jgi:lipid II:glycine glycyltransferase (peptidoglycan interpeptide bridge formation enzyme)
VCEVGRSPALLAEFYALHALTRRKHGAPIQPFAWFQNLVDTLDDRLQIYVARYRGRPAAAIMTVRHKKTMVYKYGCSDTAFKQYGGTPLLFWRAIQDAKANGLEELDLGRSDLDNPGLMAFKDHLGAQRATLTYYRCARGQEKGARISSLLRPSMIARNAFALMPKRIQLTMGSRLYRHFG